MWKDNLCATNIYSLFGLNVDRITITQQIYHNTVYLTLTIIKHNQHGRRKQEPNQTK